MIDAKIVLRELIKQTFTITKLSGNRLIADNEQ